MSAPCNWTQNNIFIIGDAVTLLFTLGRLHESTLRLSPGTIGAHYLKGTALLLKGEPEAALESFTREEGFEGAFRLLGQALALYALGRQEEHQAKLNELIERWGDQRPSWVAVVYAYMGDTDRAFEWLQKSVDEEEEGGFNPVNPFLQPLADDPAMSPHYNPAINT